MNNLIPEIAAYVLFISIMLILILTLLKALFGPDNFD